MPIFSSNEDTLAHASFLLERVQIAIDSSRPKFFSAKLFFQNFNFKVDDTLSKGTFLASKGTLEISKGTLETPCGLPLG